MDEFQFDANDEGDLELNNWFSKLTRSITKTCCRAEINRKVVNSFKSSQRCELRMMNYILGSKTPIRNIFSNGLRERKPKIDYYHRAKDLREKGNLLLRISKDYVLCSKLYTEAIFAAYGNSEETALSHANRACVLMQLGMFQEAYDDCECCLTEGYPQSKISKIIVRQANCAIHLSDIEKINRCLEKFEKKCVKDLTPAELAAILKLKEKFETVKDAAKAELPKGSTDKKQTICIAPQKGKYVVAGEPIQKDEVIMGEKAFAFVPVFGHYNSSFDIHFICQGCAETEIVPFPCYDCRNVSYCSIKCRQDHAHIHSFECKGYSKGIFSAIGISHLALRTFLTGFPEMLQHLSKEAQSPDKIWDEIMAFSDGDHNKYCEIIRLSTNFDKMEVEDYIRYAVAASFLTVYLKEYSSFFGIFKNEIKYPNYTNWEVIVSSLLLRHIVQMVMNAHSITGLTLDHSKAFWKYADLPELGSLHMLENREIFSAIYPRISLYNHCCEPSFSNRFNKNGLTIIAEKDIPEGDEIFNCYGVNFRQKSKECRRTILKMQYRFDCDCKHCKGDDKEFKKYHTYRCTNADCKRLFSPKTKPSETFWEMLEEESSTLKCPHCKHDFYYRWLDIFTAFLVNPSYNRKEQFEDAYNIYKTSHLYLEGPHEIKEQMCWQMLRLCTEFYSDTAINSYLLDVVNDLLLLIEEKNGIRSMEFIEASARYLDLLAHRARGPFSCKPKYDFGKIQSSFEILSDKMQTIFKNYVNKYIGTSCVGIDKSAK